ncbi:MAG TPA: hypothetical protein VK131_09270 [Candidatus Acidoferrales bacterium]|nr:hypothetical protein [Candidatus Acidoferrales bacterium]
MSLSSVPTAAKAVAVAVAAILVAAGAASAATGSPNPAVWGATVTQAVADCKNALQPGQHGIGQCVSAVARTHGPTVSAEHRASPARTNEPSHPTGKPTGRPTNHH